MPRPRLTVAERNELRSLIRQCDSAVANVREILSSAGWTESGFDFARLREAVDVRSDVENAILAFWSRSPY